MQAYNRPLMVAFVNDLSQQRLNPLPDHCRGADAAAVRARLEQLGPDGLDRFDAGLFKPIAIPGVE